MPPSLCAFPEHEGYRHTPVSHQAAAGCQGPCAFEKADAQLQLHLLGLEAGYAVVAVNYRLSEESIFSACLHDQKAAIRWVRAQVWEFALDTPRIACWGDSAGATMPSLPMRGSSRLSARGMKRTPQRYRSLSTGRVPPICCRWTGSSRSRRRAYMIMLMRTHLSQDSWERESQRSPMRYAVPVRSPMCMNVSRRCSSSTGAKMLWSRYSSRDCW